MAEINCLIVEDDKRSGEIVKTTITNSFDQIKVVGIAENLQSARAKIQEYQPQLLILDVNLPDGTVFDLLNSLDVVDFKIVFTTAYSKYAVEAFRFSALDFLLKPHTPDDLIRTINKALKSFKQDSYLLQLEAFKHNVDIENNNSRKLILKNNEAVHLLDVEQIIYVKADNNYSVFYIEDGREIMVSKSLKVYDQKLSNYGFFRIHQSHLVNQKYIVAFNKRDETLTLSKNIILPVSQSKRRQLLTYFDSLT